MLMTIERPATSVTKGDNSAAVPPGAGTFVSRRQGTRELTRREAQLLDYLASHAERWVSSQEIGDAVFGRPRDESVVRVTMRRLRSKVEDDSIESSQGMGYRVTAAGADRLNWRCGRCSRSVVRYQDGWVCYDCGATGAAFGVHDDDGVPRRRLECAYCAREFVRALSDQAYEQKRRPGARSFCSLRCAALQRQEDVRRQRERGIG